jgi:threonylcarbamoyladenosine tRNA methylthiotransferase MtaB
MDRMSRSVAITTLGCKTNQFESAAMEERLQKAGYTLVGFESGADLVLVNTCTVTAATDSQSRNLIRRARRLNPNCRVVVTGCYAQVDPEALRAIPGVSLVLGNEEKRHLIELLEKPDAPVQVSQIRESARAEPLEISTFAERSRAFVQIQNGCDAFCSYCIIPYARGRSRSVVPGEVVSQARRLIESGYPEIVLTGIHIGGYGLDLDPVESLVGLVRTLLRETDVRRLRLGSLEPLEIPGDLIEEIAGNRRLCPHLHIPLQAGCDSVLKRMNRHYDTAFFRKLVEGIYTRLGDAAIGLDLIAGFPGETETEFAATLGLLEDLPISHLHVFPYSRRPGTPAAAMAGHLPGSLIKERAARLRAVGAAKQDRFARGFVGEVLEVVVEGGGREGWRRGLSRNYLQVHFRDPDLRAGETAHVRITGAENGTLKGTPA